jgi:hypothetical protein
MHVALPLHVWVILALLALIFVLVCSLIAIVNDRSALRAEISSLTLTRNVWKMRALALGWRSADAHARVSA